MAGGPDDGPDEGEAVSGHDERDDYDDEPWRKRRLPEELLRTPAAMLSTFAVIQMGFSALGVIVLLVAVGRALLDPAPADPDWEDLAWYEAAAVVAMVLAGVGAVIVWNWLIIRGAARMRTCRNYRLALAAAFLSILPVPFYYCGPISAPAAIWALVILLRRDVRARFEAVARGTMTAPPPEAPDARTD